MAKFHLIGFLFLLAPVLGLDGHAAAGEAGKLETPTVIGAPIPQTGTCRLGLTAGVDCHCYDPIIDPIVAVLTNLSASSCPDCEATLLTVAHVQLGFEVPRDVPARLRILDTDRRTELCRPLEYVLSAPASGPHDFPLLLAEGCCITGDAVLEVTFIHGVFSHEIVCGGFEWGSYLITRDGLEFDPRSWMCSPSFPTPCAWGGGYQVASPPRFYVDADCCTLTATRRATWGLIKARYRE